MINANWIILTYGNIWSTRRGVLVRGRIVQELEAKRGQTHGINRMPHTLDPFLTKNRGQKSHAAFKGWGTAPVCQGEWKATQSITIWYTGFAWKKMLGKETHLFSIKKKGQNVKPFPFVWAQSRKRSFFLYLFPFIIALTLLGSKGQMACDCLVALHVSMFGSKCRRSQHAAALGLLVCPKWRRTVKADGNKQKQMHPRTDWGVQ